ncbi:hypothetical protein L6475_10835 [Prevotella sp. E9-3]|uniref:hypothetical protein n=1 Tax=Prevotella sp. E9-3 TaxID=2913621 RepID=UPI001EDA6590|nr:hypothetical protein [Prevotella sp. E9-3]UKK47706.1 hypothetical protein L6475_10835 [Prevotella sp. E9-3]
MTKKVIDFNRLPKQEYQKPVMEVIEADIEQQILAESVTNLTTSGLDDDLILPEDEEPKSGNVWEEAW